MIFAFVDGVRFLQHAGILRIWLQERHVRRPSDRVARRASPRGSSFPSSGRRCSAGASPISAAWPLSAAACRACQRPRSAARRQQGFRVDLVLAVALGFDDGIKHSVRHEISRRSPTASQPARHSAVHCVCGLALLIRSPSQVTRNKTIRLDAGSGFAILTQRQQKHDSWTCERPPHLSLARMASAGVRET
jgi:hypothetical protein